MLLWLGAGALATTRPVNVDDGGATAVLAQSSGDVGGMVMAAIALLALGLAGVAIWRADLSSLLSRSSDSDATEPESANASESAAIGDQQSAAQEREPAQPEPVEPEELTDRERVVSILDDNDGRMKQARIVDETGWSKSKVSMLLSEMEDDDEISKLRVGRENIISLSGNEPEAAGSPFDEE